MDTIELAAHLDTGGVGIHACGADIVHACVAVQVTTAHGAVVVDQTLHTVAFIIVGGTALALHCIGEADIRVCIAGFTRIAVDACGAFHTGRIQTDGGVDRALGIAVIGGWDTVQRVGAVSVGLPLVLSHHHIGAGVQHALGALNTGNLVAAWCTLTRAVTAGACGTRTTLPVFGAWVTEVQGRHTVSSHVAGVSLRASVFLAALATIGKGCAGAGSA